MSLTVAMSLLT